jgi:prevent-host-death family protein
MNVSVSDAKGQLLDLVRRVEAGEEVILTRHGKAVVRLTAVAAKPSPTQRRALLEDVRRTAAAGLLASGPDAARSQDFLYGKAGLPE